MVDNDSSPLIPDEENEEDYYIAEDVSDESDLDIISVKSNNSNISRVTLSGGLDTGGGGTSNLATLINLLKGNIGSGVLGLPSAIRKGGLIVGPCLLLAVAVMAVHCMHLIVRCSHYFCRKKKLVAISYGEVAYECTKPILKGKSHWAKNMINVFLVITQLGFCSVYLVLGSSTIVSVAHWDENSQRIVILLMAIPAIICSYVRSLERLAYISMVANVLCLFGLVSILQYCARNLTDPSVYPYFSNYDDLPLCMSMVVFAYEGIGCVLPLENQMKKPQDFNLVLNIGMTMITCLYIATSLLGYIAFGDEIQGSISLNLPDSHFYNAVKISYAVAMFFTYFIQFYVPMQILLPPLLSRYRKRGGSCLDYSFRTMMVVVTAVLAAGVPQIENFISLIGAVACSGLALVFPALFHILTFRNNGLTVWEYMKDVFIMFVGILGFGVGGYSAVKSIIAGFDTPHSDIHNSTMHETNTFLYT